MSKGEEHRFGGDWTETKLRILQNYLSGYTTALKFQPFHKVYIDAFAGTGTRAEKARNSQAQLLPELAEDEPLGLLDGSAAIALQCEPPFDEFVFVERNPNHYEALSHLRDEYPDKSSKIRLIHGDANEELNKLCGAWDARTQRAVLFLDPYGMQVEWTTIEAIAETASIDLWILFPLGIGVNRLLTRSGDIPSSWRERLNLLLGTDDWFTAFYKVEPQENLFGEVEWAVIKQKVDVIGGYFVDRLKSIFPGVAAEPKILRNSRNSPIYLLCFAAANPRGKDIALRIAGHLLRNID